MLLPALDRGGASAFIFFSAAYLKAQETWVPEW
jgi:hypothetical protein